jgi:hypothetical protein
VLSALHALRFTLAVTRPREAWRLGVFPLSASAFASCPLRQYSLRFFTNSFFAPLFDCIIGISASVLSLVPPAAAGRASMANGTATLLVVPVPVYESLVQNVIGSRRHPCASRSRSHSFLHEKLTSRIQQDCHATRRGSGYTGCGSPRPVGDRMASG